MTTRKRLRARPSPLLRTPSLARKLVIRAHQSPGYSRHSPSACLLLACAVVFFVFWFSDIQHSEDGTVVNSFSSFTTASISAPSRAATWREFNPGNLLFFSHTPKTGGSSLVELIRPSFRANETYAGRDHMMLTVEKLRKRLTFAEFRRLKKQAEGKPWYEILNDPVVWANFSYYAAHACPNFQSLMRKNRTVHTITLVRSVESHRASVMYNWACPREWKAWAEERIADNNATTGILDKDIVERRERLAVISPDCASVLRKKNKLNQIDTIMCGYETLNASDYSVMEEFLLSNFTVVGVLERLEETRCVLQHIFRLEQSAALPMMPRERHNAGFTPIRLVSREDSAGLRAEFPGEYVLYDVANRLLDGQVEAVREVLTDRVRREGARAVLATPYISEAYLEVLGVKF